MKKVLLSLLLITFSAGAAIAGDTARVLFIGNSFTAGVPTVLQNLAAANGDVVISVNSQIVGGQTLQAFSNDANTMSAIASGGYDYMVLQEQSQIPSFPDGQVATDFYPYAKILVDRMRQYSPCSKAVFYMTWGYKNGDPSNCLNFSRVCTYGGMDSLLRRRYMIAADSNNALVNPAGATWRKIRTSYPHIDLYASDNQHPSTAGDYATACAFYATLFKKSPVGNTYLGGLSSFDAGLIQTAAKAVAFDSLSYWQQWWAPTIGAPDAKFSFTVSGWTVQFNNLSTNGSKYYWNFGDGATDTARNPTHTYSVGKPYAVQLITETLCGERDTFYLPALLGAAGVATTTVGEMPVAYPNPAATSLHLSGLAGRFSHLTLTDMSGRVLQQNVLTSGTDSYEAAVAAFPAGIYMAVLTNHSGNRVVLRWTKG